MKYDPKRSAVASSGAAGEAVAPPDIVSSGHEVIKPRWTRLEYVWQIDNFWEIRALASIEALPSDNGGIVWSKRFGDEKHGVWRLKCYPYGDNSSAGNTNVSLFLSLDTDTHPNMKAYAIFGCSILSENGSKIAGSGRSYTRQKFNSESNAWGWSQFIKVEGHSLSRMLTNNENSLVVGCSVDVFLGLEACPGFDVPVPRSLQQDVIDYATCEENCDVDVRFGPGLTENYRGSSFLISARSKALRRILTGKPTSTSTTTASAQEVQSRQELCSSFNEANQPPPPPSTVSTQAPSSNGLYLHEDEADEFGSIDEEESRDGGALYNTTMRSSSITTTTNNEKSATNYNAPKAVDIQSSRSRLVASSQPIATLSVDENGRRVLTIDEAFETEPVLAFLTHLHVGQNAFTANIKVPAANCTISHACQLAQLAHRADSTSLYWECVQHLAGRMVTKEDAVLVNELAKIIKCSELAVHSKMVSTSCFSHSDKQELIKLLLPTSIQGEFLHAMRGNPSSSTQNKFKSTRRNRELRAADFE